MYSRFAQQYVLILNLLLISIIVYFLARAVSNGIKLHLAPMETTAFSDFGGQKVLPRPQIGPQPRSYYDIIVQRDIFSRRAAAAPAPAPIQNENLGITLVGTSQLSVGRPFIIVETSDGEQSLYRQGDTVPNVGRVLSIGPNRAIVLHNGHRVALRIPTPAEGGGSEPTPFPLFRRERGFKRPPFYQLPRRKNGKPGRYGTLGSAGGVEQLGPNRFLVGRATLDQNMNNMGPLLSQIRAVPNLNNGSTNGFRLSQIQPGSIFQRIGLEDGDIVTGAQGQQVTSPLRAMALVSALRNSPSISLSVIRNGFPLQLTYTIR